MLFFLYTKKKTSKKSENNLQKKKIDTRKKRKTSRKFREKTLQKHIFWILKKVKFAEISGKTLQIFLNALHA